MQIKSMNWVRNPSAWEQTQAWQKRRQEHRAIYESQNAAAQAAFGNAFSSRINGLGELALQMATKRMQAATEAKAAELQKQAEQLQLDALA